jgi:hypothetical protein
MGVLASEVGYTSATAGRGEHEVHKGHVMALGRKVFISIPINANVSSIKFILKLLLHVSVFSGWCQNTETY